MVTQKQKNEEMTSKLTQYHSKFENVSLDSPDVLNKLMAKDSKSQTLIDSLSSIKSNEEINGFFIDQYVEGSVNLPFDDVLATLEKRFKQEFGEKCNLRDLMSQ